MTVSLVTTFPLITRSNGTDTIYKCPWYFCCDVVRLTLRRIAQRYKRRKSMILHDVKVHPSKDNLKREDQLAWKIAAVAADKVPVERDVAAMLINRIIDNAAVAIGAINRRAVVTARDMAL